VNWQKDIDDWRKGEPGNLFRSQAIRDLIAMGLSAAYAARKKKK
jgi:hypothetical protein